MPVEDVATIGNVLPVHDQEDGLGANSRSSEVSDSDVGDEQDSETYKMGEGDPSDVLRPAHISLPRW